MNVMILCVENSNQWVAQTDAQPSTYVLPPAQTESPDPIGNDGPNEPICGGFSRDSRMAGIMRQDC